MANDNPWVDRPMHDGIWEFGIPGQRLWSRLKITEINNDSFIYEHDDEPGLRYHGFIGPGHLLRYRFTGEDDWPIVPEDTP